MGVSNVQAMASNPDLCLPKSFDAARTFFLSSTLGAGKLFTAGFSGLGVIPLMICWTNSLMFSSSQHLDNQDVGESSHVMLLEFCKPGDPRSLLKAPCWTRIFR